MWTKKLNSDGLHSKSCQWWTVGLVTSCWCLLVLLSVIWITPGHCLGWDGPLCNAQLNNYNKVLRLPSNIVIFCAVTIPIVWFWAGTQLIWEFCAATDASTLEDVVALRSGVTLKWIFLWVKHQVKKKISLCWASFAHRNSFYINI